MKPEDFDRLQQLLASRSGFRLPRDRAYLADHRLAPVARRAGYAAVEVLLAELWNRPVASLAWAVIEAMLNPETWFNRDRSTFDTLSRDVLPALSRARSGGVINIWSAGCSTGQEAYSLAIAALEAGVDARIIGTDLSQGALDRAALGLFTQFEIQRGLSAHRMLRWFEQDHEQWRARPELRARVRFARANLLDEPTDDARFDLIMCRNVLCDMEPVRRPRMLDGLNKRLVDDGCLILGPEDGLEAEPGVFETIPGRPGFHTKNATLARRAA